MKSNLFYKYRAFGEYTDNIFLNSEFYFSSPMSFNDPFDCNLSYRKFYTKEELEKDYEKSFNFGYIMEKEFWDNASIIRLREEANRKVLEHIGIFSISQNSKNILMWSHYADEHKGLVFELDKSQNQFFFNATLVKKRKLCEVKYDYKYELLSYLNDLEKEVELLLLLKHKSWEYEEEYRIIDFEGKGSKKFNPKLIKTIIFGCRASYENIKKIIQLCQLNEFNHVIFKKAKIVPGKFELDFDEIDKAEYL